jgi:hypothetical protein
MMDREASRDILGLRANVSGNSGMIDDRTLLAMASTYTVLERSSTGPGAFGSITVERRRQRDGAVLWAIYMDGSQVMEKSSRCWVYDMSNSSRTDEHIAATRWEALGEAMQAALDEVEIMKAAGYAGYVQILEARNRSACPGTGEGP